MKLVTRRAVPMAMALAITFPALTAEKIVPAWSPARDYEPIDFDFSETKAKIIPFTKKKKKSNKR